MQDGFFYDMNSQRGSDDEDLCVGCVAAHAVDAVQTGGLALVSFGSGNGLTVLGLEAETEFTVLIDVYLKFGMGDFFEAFCGLILKLGFYGIATHAFDTFAAGGVAGVDFGGGDDFAIAGFEIELHTCVHLFDCKFAHRKLSFYIYFFKR